MDGYSDTTIEPAYGQRVEFIAADGSGRDYGTYWGQRDADGGMIVRFGMSWWIYKIALAWRPTDKAVA